jgi:hypothetical protein
MCAPQWFRALTDQNLIVTDVVATIGRLRVRPCSPPDGARGSPDLDSYTAR